jgi:hypothetical protein
MITSGELCEGAMYKYVDEDGTVIITDSPPPDFKIESDELPASTVAVALMEPPQFPEVWERLILAGLAKANWGNINISNTNPAVMPAHTRFVRTPSSRSR